MTFNNDLPLDIIRKIIKEAELDIDTRLNLRVKPSKIKNCHNISFYEKLNEINIRREKAWINHKKNHKIYNEICGSALEYFKSPSIDIGTRKSMHLSFTFWYIDNELRLSIEANEVILQDPQDPLAHLLPPDSAELFVRRSKCYLVHLGIECSKIFDDDDDY